jgi:hypothetical protein
MTDLSPLFPRRRVPALKVSLAGGGTFDLAAETRTNSPFWWSIVASTAPCARDSCAILRPTCRSSRSAVSRVLRSRLMIRRGGARLGRVGSAKPPSGLWP